jgi:hypothetical protein
MKQRAEKNGEMIFVLFVLILLLTGTTVFATEGGGGAYPNGAENFMSGALPPAGTYFLDYLTYYSADKYMDKDGNSIIPDFKVRAVANGFRFLHMTNQQVLGGTWGMHVFIPFAYMDVTLLGKTQHKAGLADIVIDPFVLAWHTKNFHYAVALETFVPTGAYNKNDIANLGTNHWTFEPVFAITYLSDGDFEASVKLHYDYPKRPAGPAPGGSPPGHPALRDIQPSHYKCA